MWARRPAALGENRAEALVYPSRGLNVGVRRSRERRMPRTRGTSEEAETGRPFTTSRSPATTSSSSAGRA
jgi:hypothetical protein